MKKIFKAAALLAICLVMVAGSALSLSAASIKVGKTYYGNLAGEKGAGFKFYYCTNRTDPTKDRVELKKYVTGIGAYPWKDEGMAYYDEKTDVAANKAIVGLSLAANRISLYTVMQGDNVKRPVIAFTAPADGEYTFSMNTRLMWSPEEIGIQVWAGGVKTDHYKIVVQSNDKFTGTVSLKEGQELLFVSTNHKWNNTDNWLLIEELEVKYNGNPNADNTATTEPITSEALTTEPDTTPENTTSDNVTTKPITSDNGNVGDSDDDHICPESGVKIGTVVIIAIASAVAGAVVGAAITLALTKRKRS